MDLKTLIPSRGFCSISAWYNNHCTELCNIYKQYNGRIWQSNGQKPLNRWTDAGKSTNNLASKAVSDKIKSPSKANPGTHRSPCLLKFWVGWQRRVRRLPHYNWGWKCPCSLHISTCVSCLESGSKTETSNLYTYMNKQMSSRQLNPITRYC